MASTYSPSLRLELMATGDQSGTWGDTTNTNLGTLLEQSITGYLSKAMADTNQTLTNLNGASDEARNMVVEATGALTAGRDMIVPTAEKLYLIKNSTTGGFAVTVKTSAGTGVAVPMNGSRWVYCDGTNVVDGQSGPLTPTTNSSAALGSATLGWSSLFIDSSSAGTLVTVSSTDAGATAGPVINLYRNSATPAANDILGQVLFNGEDSAGNTQEYGSIQSVIVDPTSTSEDSVLDFYVQVAGTRTRGMTIGNGVFPFGVVRTQVFTASGTYTPHANMVYAIIECQGGGGGGGGVVGDAGAGRGGGGGGAGGYAKSLASKATVGASQIVTVGGGGAGVSGANGGAGATTSVGSLCSALGGAGGQVSNSGSGADPSAASGTSVGNILNLNGGRGSPGAASSVTSVLIVGGNGAASFFGQGGAGARSGNGENATAPGGGGGGAAQTANAVNSAGGAGADGIVIITEFCSE